MTRRSTTHVTCANCGLESEQAIIFSTNEFGPPDLDLRPPEGRRSTIDTWLQLCPHCGYVAPELEEAPENAEVLSSDPYRAALASPEHPGLARRFLAHAVACEAESDPQRAGIALLRAAWVCDDEGSAREAVSCRRSAADAMERTETEEGDSTVATVRVDVLRRAGDKAEAAAACEAALQLPGTQDLVRDVLLLQQRLIAEGDVEAHTIGECAEKV